MSNFLTAIEIKKVLHLENLSIEIDANEKKHLILTGKNGSGKTSLLNEIVNFLQRIKNDANLSFMSAKQSVLDTEKYLLSLQSEGNAQRILQAEGALNHHKGIVDDAFGKLELKFNDVFSLSKKIANGSFLLSFYGANRKTEVFVPKNPEKPNMNPVGIRQSKINEFLKFLVDLKIQEALARNENQITEADNIKLWFNSFIRLLNSIFEGEEIKLVFNYKDYSFLIKQGNKAFGFNELSDGYSAIIDIVADLIIKMQGQTMLVRAYEMEGIVLIDEIETHLHLKLQRFVLPMLTQVFPNLQFILTTHSPFVLSSEKNAVAFDLEKRIRMEDLTAYSYESLAEGYFKADGDSNYLQAKIVRFRELSALENKDAAELEEYRSLDKEFSEMDELLTSPAIKGQYLEIKLNTK